VAHRENHFFLSISYGLQKIEPIQRFTPTGNREKFLQAWLHWACKNFSRFLIRRMR